MGRKKNQIYINRNQPSSGLASTSKGQQTSYHAPVLSSKSKARSMKVVPLCVAQSSLFRSATPNYRLQLVGQVKKLRILLRRISVANALISWLTTVIGYAIVHLFDTDLGLPQAAKDCLKNAAIGFSFVQVVLVIAYWRVSFVYAEALQGALHRGVLAKTRLMTSPHHLLQCAAECCLHLLTPLPSQNIKFSFTVLGKVTAMSADDLAYLLLILRNYHTFRALYWLSSISDLRTRIFAEVADINFNTGFVYRFFQEQFGLQLILGIYAAMVAIPGSALYVVEHSGEAENYFVAWNNFWVVSYTQLTIGYGDDTPKTFPGQFWMLASCFFGVFTLGLINSICSGRMSLSLQECSLYSHLLYTQEKLKYKLPSIVLLQHWWRLMSARQKKAQTGAIVLAFYSSLLEFRSALVACQRVKDTRFERQVDAFEASTRSRIHPMNEYMRPVIDAQMMVQDVLRNEYRIKALCWDLYKVAHRHKATDHVKKARRSVDEQSDCSSKKGRGNRRHHSGSTSKSNAKAKFAAKKNVMERLAREVSLKRQETDE